MTAPPNEYSDSIRAFYASTVKHITKDMPDTDLPAWDDLSREQLLAVMLAYAASVEVSGRMLQMFVSLGVDPS